MNNIVIHTKSASILEAMLKFSSIDESKFKYYFIVDTRLFTDGKYDCNLDDAKVIIDKYLPNGNYVLINRKDVLSYGLEAIANITQSGKDLYRKIVNGIGPSVKIITPAFLFEKHEVTKAAYLDDDVVILKDIESWFSKDFFRIVDGNSADFYDLDVFPAAFSDDTVTTTVWESYLLNNAKEVQANAGTILMTIDASYNTFISKFFGTAKIAEYYETTMAGSAEPHIAQYIYIMDEKFWGFYYGYYVQKNQNVVSEVMTMNDVGVIKFDDDLERHIKSKKEGTLDCSVVHCIKEPKTVNMQRIKQLYSES